ncbi:MAG: C40 family peptidase [Propionibacteriaceae bacterium]|nr:C40 family peptidase [Propionibacteriaceae bacterium]
MFKWSTRGPGVLGLISDMSPDVIGFQEVNSAELQRSTLVDALDEYTWVETNTAQPIAFRTAKFAKIGSGAKQVVKIGEAGATHNRHVRWVKLREATTGATFMVLNTHAHVSNPAARNLGATRTLSYINAINPGLKLPMVILGDFNSVLGEESMQKYVRKGWVAASTKAPIQLRPYPNVSSSNQWGADVGGRFVYGAVRRTGRLIDHILTFGSAKPVAFQVVVSRAALQNYGGSQVPVVIGPMPSDHWPVMAQVSLDGSMPSEEQVAALNAIDDKPLNVDPAAVKLCEEEVSDQGIGEIDPNWAAAIAYAKKHWGKPYQWGGKSGNPGFDCSGIVGQMMRVAGYSSFPLGNSASQRKWMIRNGRKIPASQARQGDIFFGPGQNGVIGHVGMIVNPAKHTSIEARKTSARADANVRGGVGLYDYRYYTKYNEIYRVGG